MAMINVQCSCSSVGIQYDMELGISEKIYSKHHSIIIIIVMDNFDILNTRFY